MLNKSLLIKCAFTVNIILIVQAYKNFKNKFKFHIFLLIGMLKLKIDTKIPKTNTLVQKMI